MPFAKGEQDVKVPGVASARTPLAPSPPDRRPSRFGADLAKMAIGSVRERDPPT